MRVFLLFFMFLSSFAAQENEIPIEAESAFNRVKSDSSFLENDVDPRCNENSALKYAGDEVRGRWQDNSCFDKACDVLASVFMSGSTVLLGATVLGVNLPLFYLDAWLGVAFLTVSAVATQVPAGKSLLK